MLTALIIDDEEKPIAVLRRLLNTYCPEVNIVADAEDADDALQKIELHHPQLIFLDIEMPGVNGFDLLEKVQQRNFHVILVTAHDEFALKAFRFSVTDYLLKPVSIDLLKQAVTKVKNLMSSPTREELLQTLRIPSLSGVVFVYMKNIIRLEAEGTYTHIYLTNGKHYLSSYYLKNFEEHLDPNLFVRPHRTHLINLHQIKSIIQKEEFFIEMNDGAVIKVRRRNREEFLKQVQLSR